MRRAGLCVDEVIVQNVPFYTCGFQLPWSSHIWATKRKGHAADRSLLRGHWCTDIGALTHVPADRRFLRRLVSHCGLASSNPLVPVSQLITAWTRMSWCVHFSYAFRYRIHWSHLSWNPPRNGTLTDSPSTWTVQVGSTNPCTSHLALRLSPRCCSVHSSPSC